MNIVKDRAYEILNISQKIYQINESTNSTAIFGDKIFVIEGQEVVAIQRDYEEKDRFYYFEAPEIKGVIIKRKNGNYCVKTCVKYTNANNQNLWFAKIRIETSYNREIQIGGKWGGSWQDEDFYDEDFIKNPNSDFLAALVSMETHLADIYHQLCENNGLNNDLYDSKWVKKLKKYNN